MVAELAPEPESDVKDIHKNGEEKVPELTPVADGDVMNETANEPTEKAEATRLDLDAAELIREHNQEISNLIATVLKEGKAGDSRRIGEIIKGLELTRGVEKKEVEIDPNSSEGEEIARLKGSIARADLNIEKTEKIEAEGSTLDALFRELGLNYDKFVISVDHLLKTNQTSEKRLTSDLRRGIFKAALQSSL